MCNTDACVGMVKEMTAELFREQRELVARLNAMQQQIEAENDPVGKVLRKLEWMEEKERSVEVLNKIVASLQEALEADVAIGEMAAAASNDASFSSDCLADDDDSDCDSTLSAFETKVNSCDHATNTNAAAPRHPRAFSKVCATPTSASFAVRIEFMASLHEGCMCMAQREAPSEERRLAL
ncbi:hypothetical protein T484DRAFT_1962746 [Baffinella frigidus]|nr:hypothetical protein T484DRAFT_1962746 [Cryptophyta sp. CCMP2293]|mmetsp:Transcript_63935/g.152463  ORF Transcript_63935/g.152463 Transcript_63935/m.152463 type:complete len:181 (-) Transcript_63935:45-587(-)